MKVYRTYIYIYTSVYVSKLEHAPICNWKPLGRTFHCMNNSKNWYVSTTPLFQGIQPPQVFPHLYQKMASVGSCQEKMRRSQRSVHSVWANAWPTHQESNGGKNPSKFRAIGFINIDNHPFHFLGWKFTVYTPETNSQRCWKMLGR